MKSLILLAILTGFAFAQTPAAKPPAAAAKPAVAKPPAAKPAATAAKPAAAAKAPAPAATNPKLLNPSLWTKQAPPSFKAKFTTTKGDIVIEAHRDWSPRGVDRFYNLVRSGFFTNVSFYRVVPNFVVQFGASPDPKVEAAWNNARIKDDPVKQSNKKYSLTFAMGGPNTRTTEFFINLRDNGMLDGMGFSPIGEVIEGKEAVDQIYSGYGDMAEQGGRGPSQARVQAEGKAYLDKNFPNLDSIKVAAITFEEAAAPAAAKSAAAKPAAPAAKPAAPAAKPAAPAVKPAATQAKPTPPAAK